MSLGPSGNIIHNRNMKNTDTFWRVLDTIDAFNESCRKIDLGVDNTPDEYVFKIWFITTSKGDLINNSFILNNAYPLVKELNNSTWSILGGVLWFSCVRN